MNADLIRLYSRAVEIRAAEQLLLNEFAAGGIEGTLHTCIGQELLPVILSEICPNSTWFSNHRSHGHFLALTGRFDILFAEVLGKRLEGRDFGIGGSQHIHYDNFFSNGIQAGQAAIAAGYADNNLNKNGKVSFFFLGDGTLNNGNLYEALNLASKFNSKVLYVLEDNGIAQSTPSELTTFGDIQKRIQGFGLEYLTGNQLELENLICTAEEAIRNVLRNVPTFLHVKTSRLKSHSKGDDNRPAKLIEYLQENDPLNEFRRNHQEVDWQEFESRVALVFDTVLGLPSSSITGKLQLIDNFSVSSKEKNLSPLAESSFREKINLALNNSIVKFNAIILGEDIEDMPFENGMIYGGAFKITKSLSTLYPDNVVNMPISESAIVGFATGIALANRPTIVEIMFADFLTQCLDQIVHQISKIPSMYGISINLPIVIRTPIGWGNGYGPTHSSTMENLVLGLPNIEVYIPNVYTDLKEMYTQHLGQGLPAVILESKNLYSSRERDFSSRILSLETSNGAAKDLYWFNSKSTSQVLIVTTFLHLKEALAAADELYFKNEIDVEILAPSKISKINYKEFIDKIRKAGGRVVFIDQSIGGFGFSSFWASRQEISQYLQKIKTLSPDTWIPNGKLEHEIRIGTDEIVSACKELLN